MASDFQKRFQRKIADNDEEDEDKEEENNQKPVQLGFTEEKVDYHSDEEPDTQKPISYSETSKKSFEKPNYKSSYHGKPYKNPKKDYYKPQKEYVPKGENKDEGNDSYKEQKEGKNSDFKIWRNEKKEYKKKEYPEYKKYKEEYDVVYVEKKPQEEKPANDKKISFKSTNIKNIKEFVPDIDRPRQKGLKLNRDAMEFKVNEEEIDQNNEEDENLHVFIGFQQPLDLVTQNPINPNGFYQPTYPTNFPPTNFPQTNFPQTNFPQTNFPQTNFPQTNFPQNNYPQTNFPQNNYPQNQMNYGQTFYPTNNYPYYN